MWKSGAVNIEKGLISGIAMCGSWHCKKSLSHTPNSYSGQGDLIVSEETVVLRRWGSDTRKFGVSTEL